MVKGLVASVPFNDLSGILPAIGGFVLNVGASSGVAPRALIPEPLQLLRTRLCGTVRRHADEHRPPRAKPHHRFPSFENREQLDVAVPLSGRKFSRDRKSTRLNSSHLVISYAVFCLKKKNKKQKAASYSTRH